MKTIKCLILSVIVGVVVGAIDALFGRVLLAIGDIRSVHYLYLLPFLPLAGLLITFMYHKISKESLKGMSLVLETAQYSRDDIPLYLVPLVMIGTWITHLFGGSAGREGVAVQIGATLSHKLGRLFHIENNSNVMVVTGMAAGFAGLFQTPLAAVFFALEVVAVGSLEYASLLSSLVAALVASTTSHLLGLEKFSVNISSTVNFSSPQDIGSLVILGIACGLAGLAFSKLLATTKKFMSEHIGNPYKRIAYISIPLAIMLLVIHSGRYSGLGTNLINDSFSNGVYMYDWLLKLVFTIITLSIGFQGGEVTPLFSIGASLGFVVGSLLGVSPIACAAIGYGAVFASATNTLLAPILIGVEVFGASNMVPYTIVCIIAYVINNNHSIYSAQLKPGVKSSKDL